jgi:hypothetical protein
LRELWLDLPPLSLKGAAALAESAHLENLKLLSATVWQNDQKARDILTDRFGARVQCWP